MENFRLRVFRTVARTLNFRAAAEELLLTQPAVSQQIKALEAELEAPLFTRAAGGVALTPAGQALLPFADQLAALAQQATEAVAATTGATAGHLSLGASQTIGQYVLPRLLAAFRTGQPRISLEIQGGNTQHVLDLLRDNRIQLALIEGPALAHDVTLTPFLQDRLVLVVPAGHEWAETGLSLPDLAQADLLLREHGSGSRRVLEQALDAAGTPLRILRLGLTFDSTEGLLNAVEAGLGVTFVSRWAVRNQLELGTLQIARIRNFKITRMFSIARPAGPEPTGAAGLFFRFVLDRAQTLGTLSPRTRRDRSDRDQVSMDRQGRDSAHHDPEHDS
jgi:LysR family transcriptional regulator, transcriptional activator of the cysJI operon